LPELTRAERCWLSSCRRECWRCRT
jgi:hypothetical protein